MTVLTGADQERALQLMAAIAPGAEPFATLVIPGAPATKTRARFSRTTGRAYKTQADRDAEDATAWHLRSAFREPLTGNLAVACIFYRPDLRRIDADNMLKHICDAGNKVAWADDAQITAVYGVVELDRDASRTVVVVAPHVSTMDRSPVVRKRAATATAEATCDAGVDFIAVREGTARDPVAEGVA